MAVTLGALRLKNPVLTASGTSGYGVDLLPHFDLASIGGVVCKSLSLHPREGNPPLRIAETPAGSERAELLFSPCRGRDGLIRLCLAALRRARRLRGFLRHGHPFTGVTFTR